MNDNDTKEKIFTPRASNTTATLKPTEVTVEVTPRIPEEVWSALKKAEESADACTGSGAVFRKQYIGDWNVQKTDLSTKHERSSVMDKPGQVVPVDDPKHVVLGINTKHSFPANSSATLEGRVQKLEEQVDALLDRIFKHNQRAQHRI